MYWIAAATVTLLIWSYLLLARGGFWRVAKNLGPHGVDAPARHVVAVVPARNEAAVIGQAIASLLAQDFDGGIHVVVVDDASSDGTADLAKAAAEQMKRAESLTVIAGKPLPAGWTGKLWAISQGIEEAKKHSPDYLLLTDADIRHDAQNVKELVSIAEARKLDLASYMVKLRAESFAERALIPAFVYFFLQLYPPAWIASQRHRTAGAAGGCMLIRPEALEGIGGIAAIRGEIIDDCALARAVKANGGKIWLGLTPSAESIRPYGGFGEIGAMISRSAFNQLGHSSLILAATVLGLIATYVLPPVLVICGNKIAAVMGALAWLMMSVSYAPMVRFYKLSGIWAVALPAIAVFYLGATLHSAVRYWQGKGGEWKGRVQDV